MFINEYFKTPIWMEDKPEFVKSLTKATDQYIKEARKLRKDDIKKKWRFWYFVSFYTINCRY
jgi:hypothetical protein